MMGAAKIVYGIKVNFSHLADGWQDLVIPFNDDECLFADEYVHLTDLVYPKDNIYCVIGQEVEWCPQNAVVDVPDFDNSGDVPPMVREVLNAVVDAEHITKYLFAPASLYLMCTCG